MEIKILGSGCARCNATEKMVMDVLAETGITANVEKVTDLMKIAEYGVLGIPAVVIDGQVKCVGKIPKKEDIKNWCKK
jgi:small redox-active disulfide protein 2